MARPLRTLIDAAEPVVARGFLESVSGLRDGVSIKDLVDAIERKDLDAVIDLLDLEPAAFSSFRKSLREAFERGGQVAAAQFSRALRKRPRRG